MKIRDVKLRFFMISEKIFKNIATVLVSAQRNTKTYPATTRTLLPLIWLRIRTEKKNIYIYMCVWKTLYWIVFTWIFWALYQKILLGLFVFSAKNQKPKSLFYKFFVTKLYRKGEIILYRIYFTIYLCFQVECYQVD